MGAFLCWMYRSPMHKLVKMHNDAMEKQMSHMITRHRHRKHTVAIQPSSPVSPASPSAVSDTDNSPPTHFKYTPKMRLQYVASETPESSVASSTQNAVTP